MLSTGSPRARNACRPACSRSSRAWMPALEGRLVRANGIGLVEQRDRPHLLGPRRPRAHVAEDRGHLRDDVRRAHAPADAHAGGGERLADPVHEDRVARDFGDQLGRRDVGGVAEAQRPVHVVVHEVERALAGLFAARVLRHHLLRDAAQRVGGEGGAGRVERRVQAEQPRARQRPRDRAAPRKEAVLGPAGDRARRLAPTRCDVVVVVPARAPGRRRGRPGSHTARKSA